MQFQPDEHSATKIDSKNGIVWTADVTMPEGLRGITLHSGVPCFIGHIDHREEAVKFAVPKGRKDYPIVRLSGRPDLASLAESYRPGVDTPPDSSWVPKDSVRGRLMHQADNDPHMPEGLKKAIKDTRRNWSDHEDADYLIHGTN